MSDSLWPHGLQHCRLPLSFTVCWSLLNFMSIESVMLSNHFILCRFFILLPSTVSGSFPVSQFFVSGGQSIRASASVLPMTIQGWFPLGLTGLISLLSKRVSRVFSSTTVQKHQCICLFICILFTKNSHSTLPLRLTCPGTTFWVLPIWMWSFGSSIHICVSCTFKKITTHPQPVLIIFLSHHGQSG